MKLGQVKAVAGLASTPKTSARKKSKASREMTMGGLRQRAATMYAAIPDVRLDAIEEIQQRLHRGDFAIDAKDIAKKIVIEALS